MRREDADCRDVHRIWAETAPGRNAGDEEQAFVEQHISSCTRCREDAAIAGALLVGEATPARYLDDEVSRRRLIDTVITRAASRRESRSRAGGVDRQRRGSRRIAWIGVAAAAVAAIITGVWLATNLGRAASQERDTRPAVSGKQLTAEVLLCSDDEGCISSTARSRTLVGPGERVATTRGRTALELSTGIQILLGNQTRVDVVELSASRIELRLQKGYLLAVVDPGSRSRRLVVATHAGTVMVKGTVFAVESSDDRVDLRIARGSVLVEDGAGGSRAVVGSHQTVLGEREVHAIAENEATRLQEQLDTLRLLTASGSTSVEIQTGLFKGDVYLDEVLLGRAPLRATVAPGDRQLEVVANGEIVVRELLRLEAGSTLTRRYELGGPTPEQQDAGERNTTGESKRRRADAPSKAAVHSGATPPTAETAADLLAKAQRLVIEDNWTGAAQTYEVLILRYPRSSLGQAALVSLGSILLRRLGNPAGALAAFEDYLKRAPRGDLAPEAAFGRIRALRALGRREQEIRALEQFLAAFPDSAPAITVRSRLEQLAATKGQ